MDDGEVALDRDGDRDEDGADAADVAEPESHGQDKDVNGSGVPLFKRIYNNSFY